MAHILYLYVNFFTLYLNQFCIWFILLWILFILFLYHFMYYLYNFVYYLFYFIYYSHNWTFVLQVCLFIHIHFSYFLMIYSSKNVPKIRNNAAGISPWYMTENLAKAWALIYGPHKASRKSWIIVKKSNLRMYPYK